MKSINASSKKEKSKDDEQNDIIQPQDYAAIYARKSITTDNHSISSQIAKGKETLYDKGLVLYNVYSDSESASKFPYNKRKGFCALLSDMEKGKFKTLIVLKRDRLSRRFNEHLQIKQKFRKHGVKIIYSAPGEYSPEKPDSYTDFIENVLMGISEFEAEVVKNRTTTGKAVQREKGIYSTNGNIPFGFTKNTAPYVYSEKYNLVPHKNESIIAKKIFAEYVSINCSIEQLTNYAHEINDCNRTLNRNKIEYMLTNPTYASIQRLNDGSFLFYKNNESKYLIDHNKIKYLTDVKTFLNKDLWIQAALKYLNSKRCYKKRISNYLFKNLLTCNICKHNVTLSGPYYQCGKNKCFRVRKDILIDMLLNKILDDILDENTAKTLIDSKIEDLKKENTNLNKQLKDKQNQKNKLLLYFVKNNTNADISNKLNNLIKKEEELTEKISSYEDKILVLENIFDEINTIKLLGYRNEIIQYLKNVDNVDKAQKALQRLIEKVYICGTTKKCEIQTIDYGSEKNSGSLS
ncbi:recombinase family protein [Lutibacter sp. B2]|nr:recombinase family protein [Lutibacter sp. B2]